MASTVDPNRLWVEHLDRTGLATIVTSIICGFISIIVVGLRSFVRTRDKTFGLDDGFMLGGLILYIVDVILGSIGSMHGLGTVNAKLNPTMMMEATKYLMIWMLIYVCGLMLIKASICMTLFRIASTNKTYRFCIILLLAIIVGNFLTTFIGVLMLCSPVEANWNTALVAQGKAKCASTDAMIGLSYTSTAVSIATDMACAVLPGVILWRTQMAMRTKISVTILLSFGSFASISTMVRTPYIEYYRTPLDNLPYHVGNIVLWSNVESAIGLVAGSLPSLRRLILAKVKKSSAGESASNGYHHNSANTPVGLVTFGGTPLTGAGGRKKSTFRNPTDLGHTVATVHAQGDGDWRRLRDSSSDKESLHGIRADYTYEVELTQSPKLHSPITPPESR
ncbi:hypothetical protein PG993_005813 [Apiospora rasikravindrae]|uniref:Rhodopsin domain-containing protein n=1 Tax=Apiospora rasikravindrae TaxID=990691 RepID=A0ABR1TCH0_9PEZI